MPPSPSRTRLRAALLFAVLLVSAGGDEVAVFALTFHLAASGAYVVAVLQIAGLLPGVLLGRHVGRALTGRRPGPVLAAASVAQAAVAVVLSSGLPPGGTVACVALLAAVNTVSVTVVNAALPVLAGTGVAEKAYGLGQSAASLAMVLGPLAGSALFAALGVRGALLTDAATFLAVAVYGVAVRSAELVPGDTGTDAGPERGGLTGGSLLALGVVFVVIAATAGTDVAFVFLVREHVPGSAVAVFGSATAAWAVGVLAGSALAGRLAATPPVVRLALSGSVIGAVYLACGLAPTVTVLLTTFVVGGAANAVFNATLRAAIYRMAGPAEAARAFGTFTAGVNTAVLCGILVTTPFAEGASAWAYTVGGAAALAAALATVPLALRAGTAESA
ncbi:hypothetical protein GT045_00420 [Streptomyces sp. SID486]|uniref:MFS transporter n=1 Tax=unclassified Streptomyces TaxID=2593676 RepID=UPI00136B14DF|nr:MFS transporter [Streptomyces sp. SID486]MYX93322.1 hypothetical protein [Streptomyces sp. SID486]